MKKVTFGLSLALVLALALTATAFANAGIAPVAQDTTTPAPTEAPTDAPTATPTPTESSVTGVVQSIDYTTCTFTIVTTEGTTLTVTSPEGTDCSAILLGSTVQVTGALNEDGTFSATAVVLVPTELGEGTNTGFYCTNPDVQHPALGNIAMANGYDYVTILNWFCGATGGEDGGKTVLGVGEIAKLLSLSAASGHTVDELIALRQTMGWGQIKKMLAEGALTEDGTTLNFGGGDHGGPPPWAHAGGNGHGNGHGKNK